MRRIIGAMVTACVSATAASAGGPEGGDTPGSGPLITWKDVGPGAIFHTSGDTTDNTNAGAFCDNAIGPDVWYTLDLTGAPASPSYAVTVNLCDPDLYATTIYVLDDTAALVDCDKACILHTDLPAGIYEIAIDGATPSDAGVFDGTINASIGPESCPLDPACNGDPEGEPCDDSGPDTINGGCNSTPEAFGSITLDGPPVCGTSWVIFGSRDTDWFSFSITEPTAVEIELRSEMPCLSFLAEMSPGGVCPVIGIPEGTVAMSYQCNGKHELGTGYALDPGDYILFVAEGCPTCGPGILSGLPCFSAPGGDGHRYEVFLRTVPGPPPPCPWDLNENGAVDFADILQVIANWGPCPEP